MSGRGHGRGRNNDSESKYPEHNDDHLNEYWRHREEEQEEANNGRNNNNNNNNNHPPNNYNYNLEYQEWRAQQEAAANQPNNWPENEEERERREYAEAQSALRQPRRKENVNKALANRLPENMTRIISQFEGPVAERRVNLHPNFPGSPWEPNAFLPVPRNREVNPELPGNPWEANAFPSRWGRQFGFPRPQATGRWRRKNRKTRRGSRKNRKSRRSQRKDRK